MRKESLINQEKETIDGNGKKYCFYSRRANKNQMQAEYFINELRKHGRLYVFTEKDLSKFIEQIKDNERKYTCNAVEAQMATEVFIDEEFSYRQFTNAIDKVKKGKLESREWKPTKSFVAEMIEEIKGETE